MSALDKKIPPPVVAALVALAMWGGADIGPQFDAGSTARGVIAAVLAVAGVSMDVAALLAFRAARTTINPLKPERSTTLLTTGVYRLTRNPMYVGMALLLLAWAVELGALVPFAGPFVFVAYITRFQIEPEERALAGVFGEAFATYAARVRRWL